VVTAGNDPVGSKQENAMYLHPALAPDLAEQRRRDLTSQAGACRQARTARPGSPRNPARRPRIVRALRAAAAAAAIAATPFLVTPAGSGAHPSAPGHWSVHFAGHGNWGAVHSLILAHHFQGYTRFASQRFTGRWV
jgi:hypothetical protein